MPTKPKLTQREAMILDLFLLGLNKKEVAARLGVERGTICRDLNSIAQKYGKSGWLPGVIAHFQAR